MGRPGGQSRCTTVCVVAVSSWVETSQAFPRFTLVPRGAGLLWPARVGAAPVLGPVGGGGVGALLGPEGTGPAFCPVWGGGPVVFSLVVPRVLLAVRTGRPVSVPPACVGVGWWGGAGGGAGRVVGGCL